jgi:4-methylaminobutanoate oxidase (formaldehyde-forming)
MARVFGLEVEDVSVDEIVSLYPLIDPAGLVGGIFLPGDGQLNPADVTHAMAKGARARGATLFENVKVTGIMQADGRLPVCALMTAILPPMWWSIVPACGAVKLA